MAHHDDAEKSVRILDGEATTWGGLFWPRPDPPLLEERFDLIAQAIPPGTLAAGQTAGWAWTGMGSPTPFSLIAKRHPAPSPLTRHSWKIRGSALPDGSTTVRAGLECLTREATTLDLWACEGPDDVIASQLFDLLEGKTPDFGELPPSSRVARRALLVATWRNNYPWATRYTS